MSTDDVPSWLDNEKDDLHRKEIVQPTLFGTGTLKLTDPDESDDAPAIENPFISENSWQNDDLSESTRSNKSKSSKTKQKKPSSTATKGYGATSTRALPPASAPPISPDRGSLWTIETPVTAALIPNYDGDDNDDNEEENDENDEEDPLIKKDAKEALVDDDDEENIVAPPIEFDDKSGHPKPPKRGCLIRFFLLIQTYALVTNLILLVSQVSTIFIVPITKDDWAYIGLKIYMSILALIFIVIEIDRPSTPFFKNAGFLKAFLSRGYLYTFCGLICAEEIVNEKAYNVMENAQDASKWLSTVFEVSWFSLLNLIASWALVVLGIIYILMGICCLQGVKNRCVYGDRLAWKQYRNAMKTLGESG